MEQGLSAVAMQPADITTPCTLVVHHGESPRTFESHLMKP